MQKLFLPLLPNYHLFPPPVLGCTLQFTIFPFYNPCSNSSCHVAQKSFPSIQPNSCNLDFIETAPFFCFVSSLLLSI